MLRPSGVVKGPDLADNHLGLRCMGYSDYHSGEYSKGGQGKPVKMSNASRFGIHFLWESRMKK
jgi:hypothetical protein